MRLPSLTVSLNREYIWSRPRLSHSGCSSQPSFLAVQTRRQPNHRRGYASKPRFANVNGLKSLLRVSPEVQDAVANNKPVVALESTIYTHGAFKQDLGLEDLVRQMGCIPAVCGVLEGVPTVGLTKAEIHHMVDGYPVKVSRRDLAVVVGKGLARHAGQEVTKINGGTTIAGTMILARLAGIRVFGTGGLGGVHRDVADSMDISADLTELGRTRMAVVCSGCKGFLDIPKTLEYLETQGVVVSTFVDKNAENPSLNFPAFWARDSGVKSPSVVYNEQEAAAMIYAQEKLRIESGLVLANPIPEKYAIPKQQMEAAISRALEEAKRLGIAGSLNTPFILGKIRDFTKGKAMTANFHLVRTNVMRASRVAQELCRLLAQDRPGWKPDSFPVPGTSDEYKKVYGIPSETAPEAIPAKEPTPTVDIVVAGSIALDLSCDYAGIHPGDDGSLTPKLHTSNPAAMKNSVGGVGHNVALAAHRITQGTSKVKLCSFVGQDIAGETILSTVRATGLDPSDIRQLGPQYLGARTAQYVSVNDGSKSLVLAMADMDILTAHTFPPRYWRSAVRAASPRYLVVDANWTPDTIRVLLDTAKGRGTRGGPSPPGRRARTVFEPVSVEKSARLFAAAGDFPEKRKSRGDVLLGTWPDHLVDLATPNIHELAAMYEAAKRNGHSEGTDWFEVISAFNIHGGVRSRFASLLGSEMTDSGVPQQMLHLLPFIPTIAAKMGDRGVLLAEILRPGDERLGDPEEEGYVLCQADRKGEETGVGGVYMRYFPAVERVEDVVSVNGVGDTFLGALVAGLAMGGRTDRLVDLAQRAAVMTLRSGEAVSPLLGGLWEELRGRVSVEERERMEREWEESGRVVEGNGEEEVVVEEGGEEGQDMGDAGDAGTVTSGLSPLGNLGAKSQWSWASSAAAQAEHLRAVTEAQAALAAEKVALKAAAAAEKERRRKEWKEVDDAVEKLRLGSFKPLVPHTRTRRRSD